ncbi:hypothetical protein [Lake Baikal phage Baikal-20-5m-C28]|nr:hypothetical protein [Lake Baikal phage Baikal-20-5m-C28]
MQQHSKNLKLAAELLPQIEKMIEEFVNENLDHSNIGDVGELYHLDRVIHDNDLAAQREDILIYVKENLYDWF